MQDPLRDGNDLPELASQLENELSEALRELNELREMAREMLYECCKSADEESLIIWTKAVEGNKMSERHAPQEALR